MASPIVRLYTRDCDGKEYGRYQHACLYDLQSRIEHIFHTCTVADPCTIACTDACLQWVADLVEITLYMGGAYV